MLEIDTPGVISHSAKDDWLNWSHDEFRPLDSDGQALSWFHCWQTLSSFLFALCELQAKP